MSKYETYNHLVDPVKSFEDLQGRILCKVVNLADYELRFHLTEDHYVRMYHSQDCCESVSIEDIVGVIFADGYLRWYQAGGPTLVLLSTLV